VSPGRLHADRDRGSGAEAVENALKIAFAWKARRLRGAPWSDDDARDVMENRQRGINQLKVLSFEGGFHGRTLGALSATRSKAIHKLDFPAFAWPVLPFPRQLVPAGRTRRRQRRRRGPGARAGRGRVPPRGQHRGGADRGADPG
jgi:4-aminobutyrate aminotransferase-like enzyme